MSKIKRYLIYFGVMLGWGMLYLVFQAFNSDKEYYYHNSTRPDNYTIRRDGDVIIPATIVDHDIMPGYYVGLQLPAEYLECDGGRNGYKIRIRNEENYFILSTETEEALFYKSRKEFERKLRELGLYNDLALDYTAFKTSWKYLSNGYDRVDWDDCELADSRPNG
ncbi:hypothetical protein WH95_00210 [Kiloniella litopenaei]|uniref:Uncharacterized protein n=1 Tax=Kiloniella litopenaei TaxID=1549748 RepID=A0A0M2RA77_9PROT|nr:hypothetical protein [Kiloniella litopenaei]KKJ78571.1 hypothetical protein WH95_00210 [Kiloniella litopenaei]